MCKHGEQICILSSGQCVEKQDAQIKHIGIVVIHGKLCIWDIFDMSQTNLELHLNGILLTDVFWEYNGVSASDFDTGILSFRIIT